NGMVSSLATLSLLVIAPAMQRGLDVILLSSLGSTAQENDQRPAVPTEINPVAGTAIDLQFSGAFANPLDVRCVAFAQPLDSNTHTRGRLCVQIIEPPPEWANSVDDVFFNPDHLAPYMLPYKNRHGKTNFLIATRNLSAFTIGLPIGS